MVKNLTEDQYRAFRILEYDYGMTGYQGVETGSQLWAERVLCDLLRDLYPKELR